jgi:hypothetical protein
MPIIIVCPQCSTKLSAPDYAAGKIAKCPKAACGFLIPVPATVVSAAASPLAGLNNDTPPKPAAKKTVKAAVQEEAPLIEENKKRDIDEDDEELPRSKRRRDYEADEEDETPRKKQRPSEDDEDDLPRSKRRRDDGDRPRKKKKKKQSAGLPPVAIVGIVVGVLLMLGGCGYGIYALVSSDKDTSSSSGSGSGFGLGSGSGSGSGFGVGSNAQAKAAVPPGWVEFDSGALGFKAHFPVEPRVRNRLGTWLYQAEDKSTKSGCTVVVMSTSGTDPRSREEKLEILRGMAVRYMGGKEISHTDTTLAGRPATEYLLEVVTNELGGYYADQLDQGKSPKKALEGRMVLRVFVTESDPTGSGTPTMRAYYVAVKCETGMPRADWVSGFFNNFELIK